MTKRTQLGASLVEVMIALTLGSIVTLAAFQLIVLAGSYNASLQNDQVLADLRGHLRLFNETALGAASADPANSNPTTETYRSVQICQFNQNGTCQGYNHSQSNDLCIVMKAKQLPAGYFPGQNASELTGTQMLVRAYRTRQGILQYQQPAPVPTNWNNSKALCESNNNWLSLNNTSLYTIETLKLCNHAPNGVVNATINQTLRKMGNASGCQTIIDPQPKKFRSWFMRVSIKPKSFIGHDTNYQVPNVVTFQNETTVNSL